MAHDWYIKRGEKTYGPLTSAQLKKLAGEGKVSPTTELRLGAEGTWAAASRVKGLFAAPEMASPPPPIAPPPVAPSRPPVASPLTATPLSAAIPPAGPLVARPLTAKPLIGAVVTPVANPPIAGKLIGAVGLTFGVLALATCWLALLQTTFGWLGIGVGALGLLVGIAGLVVAALQNASGLVLNVAAAGSSLVGLVISVVLGIQMGLFSGPEPPAVVAPPPVIVQSPPPPAPKVEEPKPEPVPEPAPPPEPVWTNATQPILQAPIRAKINSAAVEQIRLESADPLSMTREKPAPYLRVRVQLENISNDRIVNAPGWMGAGANSGALGMVGKSLGDSDIGKQLAGATAAATLVDDKGNSYRQVEAGRLPTSVVELGGNPSLRPGEASEKHLLFDRPLDNIQYLRLELAPAGFGGSEPLRFEIPRWMWTGETPPIPMPAAAPASDGPPADSSPAGEPTDGAPAADPPAATSGDLPTS